MEFKNQNFPVFVPDGTNSVGDYNSVRVVVVVVAIVVVMVVVVCPHFLGSGPDRGQSPVEWGDFPYFRSFVCPFVRPPPSGQSSQA